MFPERIALVGLSGSGKSTVGRALAATLHWDFVDSDRLVEEEAGRPIPEIFREEGEARFREREAAALERALSRDRVVVATGGGAPTTAGGRVAIGRAFSVWLVVSPERAAHRLEEQSGSEQRPLLQGDSRARLAELLGQRRHYYELADAAVDVDALAPEQAAAEIARLYAEERLRAHAGARFGDEQGLDDAGAAPGAPALTTVVHTPFASYPVIVQPGALGQAGAICRDRGLDGRAFLVTDSAVAPLFAEAAGRAFVTAGYAIRPFSIPAGEEHKSLATVATVYDWLLSERAERSDFVVCLGGGVVTDLAGFVAATYLRGVPFVHIPTSLLAMVDAAIGGKTGVDHPRGKNMIGAFAQPRAVIVDPAVLRTLPERHLRAGWAEVLKHGLILDAGLVADLEREAGDANVMMSPDLIARSVAIKAEIVSEDERESGRRTLLNYGHTIGHAIEAVTGYSRYLHGEAVAIGMRAAGLIACEVGLLSEDGFARQQRLIRAYGLPESAPGLDVDAVLEATLVDKKVRGGAVRWVLLDGVGRATVRDRVPDDVVRRAVEAVLR